jgi:hypothetical protein
MAESQETAGLVTVYQEHPLDLDHSDNIRLVRLSPKPSPEEFASEIRVEIESVPFRYAPPYLALSYVWGSPDDVKTISLSGRPIDIRVNLWDFLNRFRASGNLEYIWADAICIDQSSNAERSHQVALMSQIFSRANRVIAWLGAGPPELVHAFRQLSNLGLVETLKQFDQNRALIKLHGPTLREASYWRRAWIIQEYILAQKVDFWCGDARMDGETQELCARMLWNTVLDEDSGLYELARLRQAYQNGQNGAQDLAQVLSALSMHTRKCVDARDRIYAILSLVNLKALEKFPIVVDYNLSPISLHGELMHRHTKQLVREPDGTIPLSQFSALVLDVLGLQRRQDLAEASLGGPPSQTGLEDVVTYSARRHAQSMNLYYTR